MSVTKQEFLRMLETMLELDSGKLNGSEELQDLNWDSLAVVSFMALADERFGIILSADRLNKAKSISELISFLGDKVAA